MRCAISISIGDVFNFIIPVLSNARYDAMRVTGQIIPRCPVYLKRVGRPGR